MIESTFHYGSIKISLTYKNRHNFSQSTFHYGSIKIESVIYHTVHKNNLHSTMVLLK